MQESKLEQTKEGEALSNLAPLNLDWIMGFIEGEGCFFTWQNATGGYVYTRCELMISQNDRAILERINAYFGNWGNIRVQKATGISPRDTYRLKFGSHPKLRELALLIKEQFRTEHKQHQFIQWFQALMRTKDGNNIIEKRWTEEEDSLLVNNKNQSAKELQVMLLNIQKQRTVTAIYTRIGSIKHRKPKKYRKVLNAKPKRKMQIQTQIVT